MMAARSVEEKSTSDRTIVDRRDLALTVLALHHERYRTTAF